MQWEEHDLQPLMRHIVRIPHPSLTGTMSLRTGGQRGVRTHHTQFEMTGTPGRVLQPLQYSYTGVPKGPNKWRLVQDLHTISAAVVSLHPVVQTHEPSSPRFPRNCFLYCPRFEGCLPCIPLIPKAHLYLPLRIPPVRQDK